MPTTTFTTGRIRKAVYDPASQQLDLHWDSKTIVAYKQVPQEVYRRLCSAPNPTTYWEDRIAEGTRKAPQWRALPARTARRVSTTCLGTRTDQSGTESNIS